MYIHICVYTATRSHVTRIRGHLPGLSSCRMTSDSLLLLCVMPCPIAQLACNTHIQHRDTPDQYIYTPSYLFRDLLTQRQST